MGQTAAEIEYAISRKRHALTGRIDRLESRVREDVQTSKDRTSERLSSYKEKATDVVGTTKGAETPVAEHPKGLVAGSALAGAVIGLLLPSSSEAQEDQGSKRSHNRGNRKQQSSSGGGLLSKVSEPLRAAIASQATVMLNAAVDSITGKAEEKKPGMNGRAAALSADALPDQDYDTLPELRPAEMAHSGTRY